MRSWSHRKLPTMASAGATKTLILRLPPMKILSLLSLLCLAACASLPQGTAGPGSYPNGMSGTQTALPSASTNEPVGGKPAAGVK